jgi:site-specific DNA-methyltransferase (cytosine-N4-specific)
MSTLRASQHLNPWHHTDAGKLYLTEVEDFLDSENAAELAGKVQLIFTSPPFPLNRKKAYGNRVGQDYLDWLTGLVPKLVELLAADGSLVIEMGNAWEPGRPVMSTLALRSLLSVLDAGDLNLCQQFVCHNTARLPSPIQWVNIERIRVKDAFTHVWWMAPTERPKANNRNVLAEYSPAMKKLLESGKYNAGRRPSGHKIGETSFTKDNGGSIPPNVLHVANTTSTTEYRSYCKENGLQAHPAPMQPELVEFFVRMLTDEGDIVLDPFAGSNTTGAVAEELGRRWVSLEPLKNYAAGSLGRFPPKS